MKYGVFFLVIGLTLLYFAATSGGLYWLCFWPAFSFGLVGLGYLFLGAGVFGKTKSGVVSPANFILLLPYLLFVWIVWHWVRLIRRETPCHQITDEVFIGRRLMSDELPTEIDHVIDLTCEFTEPRNIRAVDYHSRPILDGGIPNRSELDRWIAEAAELPGNVFIHCAEGHGRTGLFAAALLKATGHAETTEEALKLIQKIRPLVRLNRDQMNFLQSLD